MQKQLEARLVCYRQGNVRGDVLVEATDINVVLRLGEVSALTFKLPGLYSMGTDAGYVNYTRALIDNWDVALEVSWGEGWYEPFNARFEIVKEERDDDLYGKVALTGVGIVSDLAYGFNLTTNKIGKETGTHDYSMVRAGQIMSDWITSAQSQGSMPRLRWKRSGSGYVTDSTHGWTTAVDSAGKTWAANSKVNGNFQRTASAIDVLRSLVGAVEWVTRGNTLCLYNTGTLEKPLKPGGVELILGRELENIPLAREISERVQRVVAFGEKGINRTAHNGIVGGTRGPRTRAVTVGGEKESANLTARAEAEVIARQGIREELRRDMDLLHAEFLPWRDFELGARVISEGWTTSREEYTVSELILRETGPEHGLQVAVTLGDPMKSAVERIQMAVRNLSGSSGDAPQGGAGGGVAGGGGSISDPRADEGPPAAPVISSLEVHHTISPSGFTTASIQVAWNHVTLAASGEPLWRDILEYRVEGRDGRNPSNPWVHWGTTGGDLYSPVLVKDGLFPGQSYWVRVFARTQEGWSNPSTEVEIFSGQDSTPPPKPKPPILSSAQGTVTAEVTGEFVNNAARPADLSHFEVWAKRGTNAAALHSTVTGKGVAIIGSTRHEQVEVYLIAVDTSKNKSDPSDTVSITTLGVLDEPQIKQKFDDADQYFSDIRDELDDVDAAINGPNGALVKAQEAWNMAVQGGQDWILEYAVNSSTVTAPTSDWGTTVPTRAAGETLWMRTKIVHGDGTETVTTASPVTGDRGDNGAPGEPGEPGAPGGKGDPGEPGTPGISVTKITPYFRLASKSTTTLNAPTTKPPGTPWGAHEPDFDVSQAMWRTELVEFSNGDFAYTAPTRVTAYQGAAEAKLAADSKATIFRFHSESIPPPTPAFAGNNAGDVAWAFGNSNLSGPITGQWTWDGYWKPSTIDSNIIANLTVDKLVSTGNAEFNNAVVETLMGQTAFFNNLQAMRVQVGGAGLDQFPDPWFKNASAWTGLGVSAIADASMPGGGALRIVRPSTTGKYGSAYGQDPSMEIVPDATYRFRALVRGYQVSGLSYLTVELTGKTTTGITATASKIIALPSNFTSTAVPVEALIEVAPNWEGPVNIGLYAGNGTGELRIGAAHFERMTDKTLITEGSIMTEHLAATAVTADIVDSGSFSGKLFTGGTFTGSLFRTAASGARVQMDSSGLRAYNSSGSTTFNLTGASGSIAGFTITGGTIRTSASGSRVEMTSSGTFQGLQRLDPSGGTLMRLGHDSGNVRQGLAFWRASVSGYKNGTYPAFEVDDIGLTFRNPTNNAAYGGLKGSLNNQLWLNANRAGVMLNTNGTATLNGTIINFDHDHPGTSTAQTWRIQAASSGGITASTWRFMPGRAKMLQSALAANLHIDANGYVYHTTSARKWKLDIKDVGVDPNLILNVRVRDWIDKSAASLDENYSTRTPGVVAEELEEAGLSEFVVYDELEDGTHVSGVLYDRLALLLIPVVRDLRDRLDALEGNK